MAALPQTRPTADRNQKNLALTRNAFVGAAMTSVSRPPGFVFRQGPTSASASQPEPPFEGGSAASAARASGHAGSSMPDSAALAATASGKMFLIR